jgi:hypothetical protein
MRFMVMPVVPTPCPACGTLIHPGAIICPVCRVDTSVELGVHPDELDAARQALIDMARVANEPPDPVPQGTPVSPFAWVGLAMLGVGIALAVLYPATWALPVGALLFLVGAILAVVMFASPSPYPRLVQRQTAEDAVSCYYRGVRERKWREAFGALSMFALSRTVPPPRLRDLEPRGHGPVGFQTFAGWRSYWDALHVSSLSLVRRTGFTVERERDLGPTGAIFRVTMHIEEYPQWIILLAPLGLIVPIVLYYTMKKDLTVSFTAVAAKYRSRWCVLTGEVLSPLDRAIAITSRPPGM